MIDLSFIASKLDLCFKKVTPYARSVSEFLFHQTWKESNITALRVARIEFSAERSKGCTNEKGVNGKGCVGRPTLRVIFTPLSL